VSAAVGTVLALALLVVKFVVVAGLLYALARVALGHEAARHHLVWAAVALVVVSLWEAGELEQIVRSVVAEVSAHHASDGWPIRVTVSSEGR
jgi:hypothetical protein